MLIRTDGGTTILDSNYSLRKLKQDFSNVSFPKDYNQASLERAPFFVFRPQVQPKPVDFNPAVSNIALQSTPVREGTTWKLYWDVTPKSPAERTAYAKQQAEQRFERDAEVADNFSPAEHHVLLAALAEVELIDKIQKAVPGWEPTAADVPRLEDMKKVFPQLSYAQLANTIRNRYGNYLSVSTEALAKKIQAGG